MFRKMAPMLLVRDVEAAVDWYRTVLGAELKYSLSQSLRLQWASVQLGDVELMFAEREPAREWYSPKVEIAPRPADIILYVYVEDLDGLYARIKDRTEVVLEPTAQPYGIRECVIRDPFGFILVFAEP